MYCTGCGHALPQLPPAICNVCGTAHWRDAKPCASGLVTWRGRLLLVQRANEPWRGYWDTPGGFCGSDEHPILTAEREVLEETGLAVRITGLLGIWMDQYGSSDDEADRKTTLNIYYHAVPLEADPQLELSPTKSFALAGSSRTSFRRRLLFRSTSFRYCAPGAERSSPTKL